MISTFGPPVGELKLGRFTMGFRPLFTTVFLLFTKNLLTLGTGFGGLPKILNN